MSDSIEGAELNRFVSAGVTLDAITFTVVTLGRDFLSATWCRRSRARRCMLQWVCNHFNDFENHGHMIQYLEQFDHLSLAEKKSTERRIFLLACSTKSKKRDLVLDLTVSKTVTPSSTNLRASGNYLLIPFNLIGGFDAYGIFISQFDYNFKSIRSTVRDENRLSNPSIHKGDQILSINGVSLSGMSTSQAVNVLINQVTSSEHFQQNQHSPEPQFSAPVRFTVTYNPLRNFIASISSFLPLEYHELTEQQATRNSLPPSPVKPTSQSIPHSLAELPPISAKPRTSEKPAAPITSALSAIRIWRSSDQGRDQSSKLVLVHDASTVKDVVRSAIEEFGLDDEQLALYQVSVENGPLLKQSRLPDSLGDLLSRLSINSRFYLRDPSKATEESHPSLMDLDVEELAIYMTVKSYQIMKSIEASEYVDKIFELSTSKNDSLKSDSSSGFQSWTPSPSPTPPLAEVGKGFPSGHANLRKLCDLVNWEAYWPPSELCAESNLNRRVDMLKRFIKLVRIFRQLRNYNSMFCLLLGLDQTAVKRLSKTWNKLPEKYTSLHKQLSQVLDPKQNFSNYRALLNGSDPMFGPRGPFRKFSQEATARSVLLKSPVIPYLPLVLKDLSFIHFGNSTTTDQGLVNFVKMRMFSKEVRKLISFCREDFDAAMAASFLRGGNSETTSSVQQRKKGVKDLIQNKLAAASRFVAVACTLSSLLQSIAFM
ncbi:Rap guanine nucleotide exchange factor 2 [Cichlidogyrus casuarinus]|uniref:Rap guanine nucleotide exchange factor 2 n=1 Tax=Cichlidogyrus casuarinus TaxID=1844966 RepID=A0ABD2QED3_9PLAT